MLTETEIHEILAQALQETEKGAAVQHKFSLELPLLGKDGALDSLDTMIFLGKLDDALSARTGKDIVVVNDHAFAREVIPFTNMRTLAEYVAELIADA